VLLLHGTLTHKGRSTYMVLQQNLAEQGISSLSINLSLGLNDRQGEYDCAVPHTHKHTDALNEIGVWLDWLEQQGANNVTLMGHSRGGNQIAWFATERDRDSIANVVLWAPATGAQQSHESYEASFGKAIGPILSQAKDRIKAGQGDELMPGIDFIYCQDAQVTAGAFADYYDIKPQFDTPTLLKSAKKPTLVIIGSDDDVVADLPGAIEALGDLAKVQTVTIDGADHFFLDFYNEDSAVAVREFLNN
jgi:pimeloyl-ACP methyl ester carboxylesterase